MIRLQNRSSWWSRILTFIVIIVIVNIDTGMTISWVRVTHSSHNTSKKRWMLMLNICTITDINKKKFILQYLMSGDSNHASPYHANIQIFVGGKLREVQNTEWQQGKFNFVCIKGGNCLKKKEQNNVFKNVTKYLDTIYRKCKKYCVNFKNTNIFQLLLFYEVYFHELLAGVSNLW